MSTIKRTLLSISLTLATSLVMADTGNDWAIRALKLQPQLDVRAPMTKTHWVGTHNAFANPEDDTLLDYNQPFSLAHQLDKGVRELSLDVHYAMDESLSEGVRMCHYNLKYNVNPCSAITGTRKLKYGLDDVVQWLNRGHRDQVVVVSLDIRDSGRNNINKVEDVIRNSLGNLIYRPDSVSYKGNYGPENCTAISPGLTKQEVLKAGKNIILLTTKGCTSDGGLNGMVFYNANSLVDAKSLSDVRPEHSVIYSAQDGTTRDGVLGDDTASMRPSNIKQWLNAGVNFIEVYGYGGGSNWNVDNESALQPRHMVWSWAEGQPSQTSGRNCAMANGVSGSFEDEVCTASHRYACYRQSDDKWLLTTGSGGFNQGAAACRAIASGAYTFAVPRNWPELSALNAVQQGNSVWVAYHQQNLPGVWQANAELKSHTIHYEVGDRDKASGAFSDSDEVSRDLHAQDYRRVSSVSIRSGERVDAVSLSWAGGRSVDHGGSGGSLHTLDLLSGEYINYYQICADSEQGVSYRIYYLKLWTNMGRSVAGGRYRGDCSESGLQSGYEMMGFAGHSGAAIDSLRVISRKYQ